MRLGEFLAGPTRHVPLPDQLSRCECGDWHPTEFYLAAAESHRRAPGGKGMADNWVDIVFDAEPGPIAPRFVEVEDAGGNSIEFGHWMKREDGYWVLRLAHAGPPYANCDPPSSSRPEQPR